jgi:signal transduction histidine kinase
MTAAQFDYGTSGRPASKRADLQAVLALLGPAMALRSRHDAPRVVARLAEVPGISSARLDTVPAGRRSRAATGLVWLIGAGSGRRLLSVRTAGPPADDALVAVLDAFAAVLAERLGKADGPTPDNDFVAAVCHTLRGSLTSLIAFSGFLADAEKGELTGEHRQFAEIIRRTGDRMLAVIEELALIARLESGECRLDLALASIPELVRTVVAEQRPRSQSAAVALLGEVVDGPPISCDRVRLHQLLTSLVVSRLDVASPGGAVDLRAMPAPTGWTIEVTDSGPGYPEGELDQLFTAFYQASRPPPTGTPVTGLGLALSRAIAESHGGTIQADNAGGGTTIIVRLPWRRPGQRW